MKQPTTRRNENLRCRKPLPCGHSCAARCGVCTSITLHKQQQQHQAVSEADSVTRSRWEAAAEAATASGLAAAAAAAGKTDPVVGEATAGGQGQDAIRMEATVAAARARTHHATCSAVSFRGHFFRNKRRTVVVSENLGGQSPKRRVIAHRGEPAAFRFVLPSLSRGQGER